MPRKGENIYKRKDGRWEGRYIKSRNADGKVNYGYVYAKTYREVKSKLLDAAASSNIPAVTVITPAVSAISAAAVHNEEYTFKKAAAEWFESVRPHLKQSTCNKYLNLLESYIYPEFADTPITNITHTHMESHCNALLQTGGVKGKGLSPKTVTDVLSVMRNILHFAARKGICISYDAGSIQIKHHSKEMRVLSRNEQERLCAYLYSDLSACNIGILVCLFTGMRIGEICALQWEDISFEDQTIHVHQTMQRIQNITNLQDAQRISAEQDTQNSSAKTRIIITPPKSACSIRTIPVPDDIIKIMKNYQTSATGFFLTNSDQHYLEPRTLQNYFKRALQKSSVAPANFHALRHTFATRCVELGFDVKSLSEILGHASVGITMNRYVHPSMELKKENMKKLSELLAVN